MRALVLTLLVGAFVNQSSAFGFELLKGYINLDRDDRPHFVSVDLETNELTAALPLNHFFSEEDIEKMESCMDRKATHAITVEQHEAVQNQPNGVTTHFPSLRNVRCVRAPGFLEKWRSVVRQSKFH